jgi:spore coat polysaccharide biosynthesis protein SpsF (cytidylyltransferase family)
MEATNTEASKPAGDYVDHARLNEALKKFFENDENHAQFIEEINPTKSEVKKVKRAKKVKPMPTENELAKEVADRAFNDPEIRRQLGLAPDTGRASKKKSQARIPLSVRVHSEHKRNPEESYAYKHDGRTI